MARGKRSVAFEVDSIGSDDNGPIGETPAEPDRTSGGSPEPIVNEFTDPTVATGENGSSPGDQPRRRGRPRGSKNSAQKETVRSLGIDGVAGILLTIHSTLAVIARTPELELSEDEAGKIAKASVAVAKLYNVEATEKATAWVNLIGVVGAAYVPRAIAINLRLRMDADAKRQGGNVQQFPGAPPVQPTPYNGGMRPN